VIVRKLRLAIATKGGPVIIISNQRLPTTIVVMSFFFGCLEISVAADWPFLRGPNSDGILDVDFNPVASQPDVVWEATGPKGNGGVVIAGDQAFVYGKGPENLIRLNPKTGDKIWAKGNLGEWHGNLTPAISDGRVFFTTFTHKAPTAKCFDAESGDPVWEHEMPVPDGKRHYGHAGSPLVVGDVVIFNAGAGVALKRGTGEVVWEFEGLPGLATPVLFTQQGKQCVALFLGDRLIARELSSGRELWSIPWKTDLAVNAHHPLIFDNKVLINSDYGRGRAMFDISNSTPRELWQFKKGSGHAFAASVLHDGLVYGMFQNGMACLNPGDGSLRWKYPGAGSVLLIGEHLVSLSGRGVLRIGPVARDDWKPTLEARIGSGQWRNNPTYWNGNLIAKSDSGEMICVRIAR
jgi:outer membrane protein assembly factor BamB